jgi:hypothetical protein
VHQLRTFSSDGESEDARLFIPGAPMPLLLTPKQAGYLLSMHEKNVLALLNSGLLEEVKVGHGHRKHITYESISRFAQVGR